MYSKINMIAVLLFLLIGIPNAALSIIYTAENLTELSAVLDDVNEDDLILFDVDYVLTIYDDKILRPCGEKLRKHLRKKLNQLGKKERDYLDGQTVLKAQIGLVEQGMPALIQAIQRKSPHVIAFTSAGIGSLGRIMSQEKLKVEELRHFGINFSNAFSSYNKGYSIETIPSRPMFYYGILFSIPDKKGESLINFLKRVNFQPKRVIFIDDRLENLTSVESQCSKHQIEFIGVQYLAAANLPEHVDKKVAYHQYDYLIKNKQWLSDEEATADLKKLVRRKQ